MPFISNKTYKILALLIVIFLGFFHFILLDKYEINFPFEDSHRVFLSYLYSYETAPNFWGKLAIFFSSENESRPVLMRLIQNIQLTVFGQLNFKHILLFCNLYLIVIIWVFFKKYFQRNQISLFIISTVSILSLCNFELYFRNDVLLYQTATVSLSVLIFYLISKPKENNNTFDSVVLILALIFVPLGTAIGYFTLVLAGLYTYFIPKNKLWKSILTIFGFQLLLYFIYHTPTQGEVSIVENIIKYNYELIIAYFMTTGGFAHLVTNNFGQILAGFTGIIITLIPFIFFIKNYTMRKNDFELLIYIFSLICLVAIVMKRYNYWEVGYDSVLESRYKIYGILIFIVFCYTLSESVKFRYLNSILLISSISLYAIWHLKSTTILNQKIETQFFDAYNMERGIGNTQKIKFGYVDKEKFDYLVYNKIFNPREAYNNVSESINKGIRIRPVKVVNSKLDFDTNMEGDWGGRTYKINKIIVQAKLPIARNYFLEITDINNKKILLNGLPESKSLFKRLFEKNVAPSELSREFDNEFFGLKEPVSVEVICTDIYQ